MTKKWTTSNQELIFEAMTCYMHTFISLTISFKRYICFLDVHLLKDMLQTIQYVIFMFMGEHGPSRVSKVPNVMRHADFCIARSSNNQLIILRRPIMRYNLFLA